MQLDQFILSRRQGVVACEVADDNIVFFYHDKPGFRREEVPFVPSLLLSAPDQLDGFAGEATVAPLKGDMLFRYRAHFPNVETYLKATAFLKGTEYYLFRDLAQQALQQEDTRLFSGMRFHELRRFQFTLLAGASEGHVTPDPKRAEDEILVIGMADSTGWQEIISQRDYSEKELIARFVAAVRERDPDALEAHNLSRVLMPYLETRAKRHKVKLELGRGGQTPTRRASRFSVADRFINFNRYEIFGRHVVDTMHLAMIYDVSSRSLDSYQLGGLCRHFNLSVEEQVFDEEPEVARVWREEPEQLLRHAAQEVAAAACLSAVLSPSYFYQTSVLPMKYQDVIVRGSGTSLDAMFVAEYLKAKHSLPVPEEPRRYEGALTRVERTGIFREVWHCDVRSLYPSILLAEDWAPTRDVLRVFPRLLDALRTYRLKAKDAMREEGNAAQRKEWEALQSTFKILINSFYGYLGFAQGTFNDYGLAEKVTARGREILNMMLDFLNDSGANVLEMDTDGIYFQPPADAGTPEVYQQRIQQALPPGIEVELDKTYAAMFSYKSKNYALLERDGTVQITGAALKSRGLEPFQRRFISSVVEHLLKEEPTRIAAEYEALRAAIANRSLPLADLAKTENLNDSLMTYKRKMEAGTGRRSASFELAIRSKKDYQPGDRVTYYLTGEKKKVSVVDHAKLLSEAPPDHRDENIAYYLNKLEEQYANFKEFLPEESNPLGI